jgi:hypothetical protein
MNVVLLLGAGATVSDVATRPPKVRPPLDKGFFSIAEKTNSTLAGEVARYMRSVYATDITNGEEDSLEQVMGHIYTDMFNPALEETATEAFRTLLNLFTRRLAKTTNDIEPTNKRLLYRIITRYLSGGVSPSELTIITFNQDLQVEKSLCLMSEVASRSAQAHQIFNFLGCYCLGARETTWPSTAAKRDLFDISEPADGCIRILKLHGSLNWFSTHPSAQPSPTEMFDPTRILRITRRKIIHHEMTYKTDAYTLPVVVPPVTHKSAVLHNDMKKIWQFAEEAMARADEMVIFGYSCPLLDFESANQLQRSQRDRPTPAVTVIDTDGAIAARYIDLLKPSSLGYFASAKAFLAARRV